MTTSCFLSSSTTFFTNSGAAFFALTSSLCVWPKPNRWLNATAMLVLPTPGTATGTMTVFPKFFPSPALDALSACFSPAFCSADCPSLLSSHFKNRSRVAMMPFPCVYVLNWSRSRLISLMTQFTYTFVSGRRSFPFGTFEIAAPFDSNVFVTSRQSRYIMYGSSNLTLKKNEEPGSYGDKLAGFPPLVGGSITCVRTTKPSSDSPFHLPDLLMLSVNSFTSGMDCRTVDLVAIKPHLRANASTVGWSIVLKCLEHLFSPCRWSPVWSAP